MDRWFHEKILRYRKEKPVETLLWLRKPITENQSNPLNALKVVKIDGRSAKTIATNQFP